MFDWIKNGWDRFQEKRAINSAMKQNNNLAARMNQHDLKVTEDAKKAARIEALEKELAIAKGEKPKDKSGFTSKYADRHKSKPVQPRSQEQAAERAYQDSSSHDKPSKWQRFKRGANKTANAVGKVATTAGNMIRFAWNVGASILQVTGQVISAVWSVAKLPLKIVALGAAVGFAINAVKQKNNDLRDIRVSPKNNKIAVITSAPDRSMQPDTAYYSIEKKAAPDTKGMTLTNSQLEIYGQNGVPEQRFETDIKQFDPYAPAVKLFQDNNGFLNVKPLTSEEREQAKAEVFGTKAQKNPAFHENKKDLKSGQMVDTAQLHAPAPKATINSL